eukprot:TRINITY_DN7557_c0_g1_i1.p1 TRINITY_DN7557_c0_g1~~TRINITY_DN7557_c0_g1_i1.p1  ORF type:complete len:649 (-),score=168.84 TRINITY_DN7557_c0_g1_i1:20-1936(-)
MAVANKDVALMTINVFKSSPDVKLGIALELDSNLFSHGGLVTVKRVEPGGLCHQSGLAEGDIVDKVNGKKVEEPGPATELIRKAQGQVAISIIRRKKSASAIPEGAQDALALAGMSQNTDQRRIQIPKPEMDAFIAENRRYLNEEAIEVFKDMFAEDQRRVLNHGPLIVCKSPDELYRYRIGINLEKEKEFVQKKGKFEPNRVEEWESRRWCKENKDFIDDAGQKQLLGLSPEDQWRIISEGPAIEQMDPAHMIKERAKRSKELVKTVEAMFSRRVELANDDKEDAEAQKKPLFDPKLAGAVQDYMCKAFGAEVPASQRRTGGFGVQHMLEEEDQSKKVGNVKGIGGVVEILKQKYQCNKGQRLRVIGENGGPNNPAGQWRLEGGKTIPKLHYKEGGWKWVMEAGLEQTAAGSAAKPGYVVGSGNKDAVKDKKPQEDKDNNGKDSEPRLSLEEWAERLKGKIPARVSEDEGSSDDFRATSSKHRKGKAKPASSKESGETSASAKRPKASKKKQAEKKRRLQQKESSAEDESVERRRRPKKGKKSTREEDSGSGDASAERRPRRKNASGAKRKHSDAEDDSAERQRRRANGRRKTPEKDSGSEDESGERRPRRKKAQAAKSKQRQSRRRRDRSDSEDSR